MAISVFTDRLNVGQEAATQVATNIDRFRGFQWPPWDFANHADSFRGGWYYSDREREELLNARAASRPELWVEHKKPQFKLNHKAPGQLHLSGLDNWPIREYLQRDVNEWING